jgi:hypothetical protein
MQSPAVTQMIWRTMEETSLYLSSSGGTKKGQGQATKLFPGDYCTTGPQ